MMQKKLTAFLAALLLFALTPTAPARGTTQAPGGAVYEIFVRSFYDADGDGIGDLRGVRGKLPYIKALGVKGIWLMPVSPSPSYHKYDVTDYLGIDPEYGSLDDFDTLARDCEESGLSLILDLVINHTSSQHPWFISAVKSLPVEPCGQAVCPYNILCRAHNPYIRYYLFSREKGGHPLPEAPGWFYHGNFGAHMPDLNLDEPLVRDEIEKITAFWLGRGADGFRLDGVIHFFEGNMEANTRFLSWLNLRVKALNPNAYMVAEAWTDQNAILSLYQSGIDSLFDFPLANATGLMMSNLNSADGAGLARRCAEWHNQILAAYPAGRNAPFLSNHDMGRSAGMMRLDVKKEKLAASIYLLLPGVPFIYYGEELGMTGSGMDENKRLPMLWSTGNPTGITLPPVGADQTQRLKAGADEQENDPNSLLRFYREILDIREQVAGRLSGKAEALDVGHKEVMALRYHSAGGSLTILHNLGDSPLTLKAPLSGSLTHRWDAGGGLPLLSGGTLTLMPFSGCIFQ
jgi:alpha-amylase